MKVYTAGEGDYEDWRVYYVAASIELARAAVERGFYAENPDAQSVEWDVFTREVLPDYSGHEHQWEFTVRYKVQVLRPGGKIAVIQSRSENWVIHEYELVEA